MGDIMIRGLAEILKMAAAEKKTSDKIAVLTMNDSPQLRKIIKYVLDPQVVWWDMLNGTPPPYKPNRYLDAEGRLFQEMRILYMFCEAGDEWMGLKPENYLTRAGLQQNPKKREKIWIQLLESITPDDAELLCAAPKKEFPFKGLPRKVIDEAFPGLLAAEGTKPMIELNQALASETEKPAHGLPPQVADQRVVDIDDILG